ncbi:MAG: hypothetical protein LH609_20320 [Rudanella sp.]|nr:hypothetical protein [Rudanella sp.]
MNLDELKTSWKTLDNKLMMTHALTEKMARTLINDRSRGTVASIMGELKRVGFFFAGLMVVFGVILATNPFDYSGRTEFIPVVLYSLLVVVALFLIAREYQQVRQTTLAQSNLHESLNQVIRIHEQYLKTMDRVWKLSLVIGCLFGLSLVARHFSDYGLAKFVLLASGQALTVVAMYALAKWLMGQAPNSHIDQLKAHLEELEALEG